MAMTKLALLLALAIGGLALCDGRPHSGRGLLAKNETNEPLTCPEGGVAFVGNNRPNFLVTCATGSLLCQTTGSDCSNTTLCTATCSDGTELVLSGEEDGTVTFKEGGKVVDVEKGQYKGCDAYCEYPASATKAYTPRRPSGTFCGLSHADFCYSPCKCDKAEVVFYYDGGAVEDVSACPGDAMPDSGKYTSVDNCGRALPVTVSDSSTTPEGPEGPTCGTITRTLTAQCGDAEAVKLQKITYGDSDASFTDGCPVEGSSTCEAARVLTPAAVTYIDCVFEAQYNFANACGKVGSKTVTSCTCAK